MRFLRSTALLALVVGCRTAMPSAATYSADDEAEVLWQLVSSAFTTLVKSP